MQAGETESEARQLSPHRQRLRLPLRAGEEPEHADVLPDRAGRLRPPAPDLRNGDGETEGAAVTQPVDIRSYRSSEQKVVALENAKAALKKHHDHMLSHYAELQEHIAVVDEQLQMADTAMEAIDAQLLIHRSGS